MRASRQIFLLCFCLFWSSPAKAQENTTPSDFDAALKLYQMGDYDEAARVGAVDKTADGLALAAQATLVIARYYAEPDEQIGLIEHALELTEYALNLDPDHVAAHIHRAIALGFRGRIEGSSRDARDSKKLIDHALTLAPENSWVWAALGGWHGEVVRKAGSFFGSIIFGAKFKKGKQAFAQAMELAPDSIAIRTAYVRMLLKVRPRREHGEIIAQLDLVTTMEPEDAFDIFMIRLADAMMQAIKKNDKDRLGFLLEDQQPLGLLLDHDPESNGEIDSE